MEITEKIFKHPNFFALLAGISFFVSLCAGTLGGIANSMLWVIFALVGSLFVWHAFRNFWKYSVWLVVVYIFGGAGAPLLATGNAAFIFGGLVCEALSVLILRDLLKKIIELRERYENISLGLWSLAVLLFFVFSNLSFLDFSSWIAGRSSLYLYFCSEVMLIFLALYILYFLEVKFKHISVCPVCRAHIKYEKKGCPRCDADRIIAWCSKEEHYLINCEYCGVLTPAGEKCRICGKNVKSSMKCNSCNKIFPISEWKT